MKLILLIISIFLSYQSVFSQTDTTYFFKEVGLSIKIPQSFEKVSAEEDERLRSKGQKTMENASNIRVDDSETKNLLSVRHGLFNYINITITPYQELQKNGWEKDNQLLKDVLYKSFVDKVTPENLDTATSFIMIDAVTMNRFTMNIKLNAETTMKMVVLAKFYKGFDFGICYVFVDPEIGKDIENFIYNSTFKK